MEIVRIKKTVLSIATILGLVLAQQVFAQEEQEDWDKIQLKATKVAGSVFMIDMVKGTGGFAGGNVGVSVGLDGIVLVDDMYAPLAPKIVAVLKTISDKSVRFVINTHVHGDHTDGNRVFGETATIIAHANTRKQLSGAKANPVPTVAWPTITIQDSLTLHQNGEGIRIIHFPKAHSTTDVVVFFTHSNVVHMGDMYFSGMFPFISDDGSIKGLIAGIEKVLNNVPANAKVIPGHGPLSNADELRATLAMLKETSVIIENGIREKKSLEQMTKEKVLARYDKWAGGYINTDQYLEQMYKVLTSQFSFAQSVDDVIEKHITALGGKEKLLALKTVKLKGATSGGEESLVITKKHMVGVRMDASIMNTENFLIVTPEKTWRFMPIEHQTKPIEDTEEQHESAVSRLDIQSPFLNYKEKRNKPELQDTESVNGIECYKLFLTFKNGKTRTYFIDTKNYMIIKTVHMGDVDGKASEIYTYYTNYKQNKDGYWFPYSDSASADGANSTNYESIETNISVDDTIFKVKQD